MANAAKIYNIALIKCANKSAGRFYFEKSTMRYFRSRVSDKTHNGPGGVYFVTSEQHRDTDPRLYSVRRFHPETADIDTAGTFQQYTTSAQAHGAAARLARSEQ